MEQPDGGVGQGRGVATHWQEAEIAFNQVWPLILFALARSPSFSGEQGLVPDA